MLSLVRDTCVPVDSFFFYVCFFQLLFFFGLPSPGAEWGLFRIWGGGLRRFLKEPTFAPGVIICPLLSRFGCALLVSYFRCV